MNALIDRLFNWLGRLRLWFTVYPWQMALRIRLGKTVRLFGPGVHFKVPWIDAVFVKGTRTVVVNLPIQTVSTTDGVPVTLSSVVSYRVVDIERVYATTYSIDDWVINVALAKIAEYVGARSSSQIDFGECGFAVSEALCGGAARRGLEIESVGLTDFVKVKTYRLIGNETGASWYTSSHGVNTKSLDTTDSDAHIQG